MDKRNFGKELEQRIVNGLKSIFPNCRPSKGSGNCGECGDISGQDFFIIEAKNRNTKDITIKEDVWMKLKSEIALHSKRIPLYVLGNKNKKTWAVLELDDFLEIFERSFKNAE